MWSLNQREVEAALPQFTGFKLLGQGAFGSVYEVFDPTLNRQVALKATLHDTETADPHRTTERFFREFDLLNRARTCDHVVAVFRRDATRMANGRYLLLWYTMERCLDSVAGRMAQLPLSVRLCIVTQLFNAVAYLTAQGIAHRDLKPQNLFIQAMPPSGKTWVKLGDFGIARSMIAGDKLGQSLTSRDLVPGTAWYMAPELFDSSAPRDPLKADQYALAVVAYEILARGKLPFGNDKRDILALIRAKGACEYHPLSPPDFHGDLAPVDRVIRRMLNPEPEKRYRHVSEAERALNSAFLACDLPSGT